jgi:hypothetical protein
MAERIYTIPINEAFDKYEGCPLCRLRDKLEEQTLSYVLGAAMMEPDVRIEMNAQGFCHKHFDNLFNMKNKLALALILESHLDEVRQKLDIKGSGGKKPLFGAKKQEQEDAADSFGSLSKGCFVCSKIRHTEARYYSNTIYLWENDRAFREKLIKQPYFCVSHFAGLLKCAKSVLKQEAYIELYNVMTELEERYIRALREDVTGFCVSFDHRNAEKPLSEGQRQSIEKAIKLLR